MSEDLLNEIKEWLAHCDPELVGRPDDQYAITKAYELFTRILKEEAE